jgi:hypothetical protein
VIRSGTSYSIQDNVLQFLRRSGEREDKDKAEKCLAEKVSPQASWSLFFCQPFFCFIRQSFSESRTNLLGAALLEIHTNPGNT